MSQLEWIRSAGGALICMEQRYCSSWGGVFRLSVEAAGAVSDYDRPNQFLNYIQNLPLKEGFALIFGEGPLRTAFYVSPNGSFYIVRIEYTESVERVIQAISEVHKISVSILEEMSFEFDTTEIVLFDSAEEGGDPGKEVVTASVEPGRYRIETVRYEPDEETSLILHRFRRLHDSA